MVGTADMGDAVLGFCTPNLYLLGQDSFGPSPQLLGFAITETEREKEEEEEVMEEHGRLKLYSYWRSSCSARVRIALHLKGIPFDYIPVNLLEGDQFAPDFLKVNPLGYVPALVDGDVAISDSFAILMYLEDKFPQTPLFPSDLLKKAITTQAASIVSSSIQPLRNLAVLKFIEEKVGPHEKLPWAQFHIQKGFTALEKLLKDHAGRYAVGDQVSLADLFLHPQIDAAIKRFSIDMTKFPLLLRLYEAYNEIPAFQKGMPEKQPDYPSSLK